MKLISCHIENFGRLSKYNHVFEEGLNVIYQDNGWGKTTLAAFLKAMFYGLDYSTKKKGNERKSYYPWNGGKLGGNIVFEHNNKKYKMTRFFGKTAKTDTFEIINLATNLVTTDFTEDIGNEIWGVDRESYENTAFITLKGNDLLNSIISQKLGGLDDKEADMDRSQEVVNLLESKATEFKAKRGKKGLLNDKDNQIGKLKQQLDKCIADAESIDTISGWIDNEKADKNAVDKEMDAIVAQQDKLLLYQQKRQYIELKKEFDQKEKEFAELHRFFDGDNVELNDLQLEIKEINDKLSELKSQIEIKGQFDMSPEERDTLDNLAKKFESGVPRSDQLEVCNNNISKLSNLNTDKSKYVIGEETSNRYDYLDSKFKDKQVSVDNVKNCLNSYQQVNDLNERISTAKDKIREIDSQQQKTEKSKISPLLIAGIVIALLGIVAVLVSIAITGVLVVAGIGLIVYSLKNSPSNHKNTKVNQNDSERDDLIKQLDKDLQNKTTIENNTKAFLAQLGEGDNNITAALANILTELSDYNRLKKEIETKSAALVQLEKDIVAVKKAVDEFLSKYDMQNPLDDYQASLRALRSDIDHFHKLFEKNESLAGATKKLESTQSYLDSMMIKYFGGLPESIKDAVEDLNNRFQDYKAAILSFNDIKRRVDNFSQNHDITQLDSLELPEQDDMSLKDSLSQRQRELSSKRSEIIENIAKFNSQINELSINADKIEDIESQIAQNVEEKAELEKQYELLSLAMSCMNDAKESLASKYMGEMNESLKTYLAALSANKPDAYQVDIDLKVKLEENGELHDSAELSTGMQDLIQLCMRLSLVDAVYKNVDAPLLILDDPFINLDNERIDSAKELINKISEKYQIIYFICHDSRLIA